MRHIPSTSRIFIGLFVITMLLVYVALALSTQFTRDQYSAIAENQLNGPHPADAAPSQSDVNLVSTDGWSSYTDNTYPISFKYPKAWSVTSAAPNNLGFATITIKPNDKSSNFTISISKTEYLGFDGLKQSKYTIGKLHGTSIGDNLIGAKSGEYYYTFDGSLNPKLTPEFQTLLSTVSFQ